VSSATIRSIDDAFLRIIHDQIRPICNREGRENRKYLMSFTALRRWHTHDAQFCDAEKKKKKRLFAKARNNATRFWRRRNSTGSVTQNSPFHSQYSEEIVRCGKLKHFSNFKEEIKYISGYKKWPDKKDIYKIKSTEFSIFMRF